MKNEKQKNFDKEVGSRIKTVIKLRGLTQEKVAEMIPYSSSAFSTALSGEKKGLFQGNLCKTFKNTGVLNRLFFWA